MADGGELKAIFKGAQEDMAQAVESAASKMAAFGDATAQNVRDSVAAIQNADGASADAIRGIRNGLNNDVAGSEAERQARSPLSRLLNGESPDVGSRQATGGLPKWINARKTNSAIDNALEHVNPKFDPAESAYSENCTGVVQANELTRRGVPTRAGPLEESLRGDRGGPGGRSTTVITRPWGRDFTEGTKEDIEKAFSEHGSRGVVYIAWNWPMKGAHVFNVENVEGQVRFVDGQPNPPVTDASHYFKLGHSTAYVRLDDLPAPFKDSVKPYLENDS